MNGLGFRVDLHTLPDGIVACRNETRPLPIMHLNRAEPTGAVGLLSFVVTEGRYVHTQVPGCFKNGSTLFCFYRSTV